MATKREEKRTGSGETRTGTIELPGIVPPNGEIKFGEKNDEIKATIA